MKYLAIVFGLFFSLATHAQPKIKGLGPYKIGVTTVDSIDQRKYTELGMDRPDGPGCAVVRKFYRHSEEIGGVDIKELELWFYADRLYKLQCNYTDDIKEAMLDKYGKPTTANTKRKEVKCIYKLTGRTSDVLISETTQRTWVNNGIVAVLLYSLDHDSKCEPIDRSYFSIFNQTMAQTASGCELNELGKKLYQQEKERRSKLKDF